MFKDTWKGNVLKELHIVQIDCISSYEVGLRERERDWLERWRRPVTQGLDDRQKDLNFILKAMERL